MFLEMQVSLAPTLVHPSVTLSEFHSVSVSHGGAHGGRHGGRKKKKIWPTWSWTWWPTKEIDIDMEVQFGDVVGHGSWAQTFLTRSSPSLRIF